MAYGYGASVTQGQDACDLFSLSGDFLDPFISDYSEMLACYEGTLKSVKLALPVNYNKIIKFAIDLAASEFSQVEDATQTHNYFVLVLLMAGVIDDLQASLNEILKAENVPISIVIIKVGNLDEQDSSTLMQKASEVLAASSR